MNQIEKYKKEFARKGGKAKNKNMTPEERKAHAVMMVLAKQAKRL